MTRMRMRMKMKMRRRMRRVRLRNIMAKMRKKRLIAKRNHFLHKELALVLVHLEEMMDLQIN